MSVGGACGAGMDRCFHFRFSGCSLGEAVSWVCGVISSKAVVTDALLLCNDKDVVSRIECPADCDSVTDVLFSTGASYIKIDGWCGGEHVLVCFDLDACRLDISMGSDGRLDRRDLALLLGLSLD